MDKDSPLFKKTSFADLMQEIHSNQRKKDRQINLLIAELKPLIQSISDATVIVPLIKEYLEVSVKNDDHLVKLLAVTQRWMATNTKAAIAGGDNTLITDEEKEQLLRELENIQEDFSVEKDIDVNKDVEEARAKLKEIDEEL